MGALEILFSGVLQKGCFVLNDKRGPCGQTRGKEGACESERLNLEKGRALKRCFRVRTSGGSFVWSLS